jgi:hypothetical protein
LQNPLEKITYHIFQNFVEKKNSSFFEKSYREDNLHFLLHLSRRQLTISCKILREDNLLFCAKSFGGDNTLPVFLKKMFRRQLIISCKMLRRYRNLPFLANSLREDSLLFHANIFRKDDSDIFRKDDSDGACPL